MKGATLRAIAAAFAAEAVSAVTVSPAQQVINMLSDMKDKGLKMMQVEKMTYQKYAEWVDDHSKDLALEIKSTSSQIDELLAFVAKADSDVTELGHHIGELDREINTLEMEKKEAADDRKDQNAEYQKVSQDYAESLDALQRAIQVLSQQDYDRDQAASMLQKMAQSVKGMPRVLAAFLQQQERAKSGALRGDGAPAVAAYEFQSTGIVDMLKGLMDKFKTELSDVEKAESNEAHAFAMAELHLSNTITREAADRDEKSVAKGQRAEESAKAKGELATAKDDKAADKKLKAEVEATFRVKAASFEENQKVRAAELEAVGKAIEILSSPDVQQSYAQHLALAQAAGPAPRAVSFLQMHRHSRRVSGSAHVSQFLSNKAAALHSKALASLATQIAANPFGKVIEMVENLLEKLKEEAASEADHKAWCDKELKANKEKRNKKTAEADKLLAEIEGKTATVTDMGDRIATLSKEQAGLATAMSEATNLRSGEKAENEQAIADAAAGSEAVKRALVVLKEFYEAQAPAAALLQQQQKQVPDMAAYKGMQGNTGGVIGMLEVIESDFSRLRSDTEANEHAAATEYDRFMKESTASKKQKHEAEFQLKLDKDQTEFDRSQLNKDLNNVQTELQKANLYYGELRPSCVQVHVSYEERVAGREEEIDALKQAYQVLDRKSREA